MTSPLVRRRPTVIGIARSGRNLRGRWNGDGPSFHARLLNTPNDSTRERIGCSWGMVGPLRRIRNLIDQSRLNLEQVMSSTAVRTVYLCEHLGQALKAR